MNKNDNINKWQHTTSGIEYCGVSGYGSIVPRIRFGVTGQESSSQSPTFHTINHLA